MPRSITGTLLRDAAKYLVALLIPAFVEIARVPVVTHRLGRAEYRNYVFSIGTAMLLAIVSVACLSATLVRFLPRAATPEGTRRLTGAAFRTAPGTVLRLGAVSAAAITLAGDRLPVGRDAAYLGLVYFVSLSFDRFYLSLLRGRRLIGH